LELFARLYRDARSTKHKIYTYLLFVDIVLPLILVSSVYATETAFFAADGSIAATDVWVSLVDGKRFLFGFRNVLVMMRS
jgi:uncharacterized membrane protein YfhO